MLHFANQSGDAIDAARVVTDAAAFSRQDD